MTLPNHDNIDSLIYAAKKLVKETDDMQRAYHLKSTKAAIKKNQFVWNVLKRHNKNAV